MFPSPGLSFFFSYTLFSALAPERYQARFSTLVCFHSVNTNFILSSFSFRKHKAPKLLFSFFFIENKFFTNTMHHDHSFPSLHSPSSLPPLLSPGTTPMVLFTKKQASQGQQSN